MSILHSERLWRQVARRIFSLYSLSYSISYGPTTTVKTDVVCAASKILPWPTTQEEVKMVSLVASALFI
jgi:hypothetical protein